AAAGPDGDGGVAEVLDAARALGAVVPVQVWDPAGPARSGDAVEELTLRAVQAATPGVDRVATDPAQVSRMIDAAGGDPARGGLPTTEMGGRWRAAPPPHTTAPPPPPPRPAGR